MIDAIKRYVDRMLRLPEVCAFKDEDFDSPEHNEIQLRVLERKPVLDDLYRQYTAAFAESYRRMPAGGMAVEIGSGSRLLKRYVPHIISSDVVCLRGVDIVFSASQLPFKDNSVDRLFLMYVFHHLNGAGRFLDEAYRCLKAGGEIVILDPAITFFSKFYYRYLHVDRIDMHAAEWGFPAGGRLSSSNVALLWIVLQRDRNLFMRRYPLFEVGAPDYCNVVSFLLSGGFRLRQLAPRWFIRALYRSEKWFLRNLSHQLAVTQAVVVRKKTAG